MAENPDRNGLLKAWLELLRLPNWLTVPGDPLAGFLLATSGGGEDVALWRVIPAIVAAILVYAAGMLWNDVADYAEDSRERPERPLPSGRLKPGRVLVAGGLLLLAAPVTAAFAGMQSMRFAAVLGLLVAGYDFGRRPAIRVRRYLSYINMGLCRGTSLLLGASAAMPLRQWPDSVLWAALLLTVYVAAVTAVAFGETRSRRLESAVGHLLRFLIVVQALFCFYAGDYLFAALLLCIWGIAVIFMRSDRH